jgi:anti-anti-sigma regulatory factor
MRRPYVGDRADAMATVVSGERHDDTVYADKQLAVKRTSSPNGLTFAGAIDYFNVAAVAQSLTPAVDGGGDLHIDLSRLEFCDVSGIRAFVRVAEAMNGNGRLLLHGLPVGLQTAMTAVGWGGLPSLVICNGGSQEQ